MSIINNLFKNTDKGKLHHFWKKLTAIKPIYILGLTIFFGLISAWALRQNNLKMIELREKVLIADETNGDIEGTLNELNSYVINHMNTSLGQPLELVSLYNREYQKRVQQNGNVDNSVYEAAERKCTDPSTPVTVQAECIQNEVSKSLQGSDDIEVNLPTELFSYNFVSPLWSADFAGFMVLLTTISLLLFIVYAIADKLVRSALKEHR